MDGTGSTLIGAATASKLDAMIRALEKEMPQLQLHNGNVFALANAWTERHDAILALTPRASLDVISSRLDRIGIRWGLSPGARITREFPALGMYPLTQRVRDEADALSENPDQATSTVR